MKKRTPEIVSRERQLLALVCRALDDKKAADLKVLDVQGLSSITDYLVLTTGLAEPHLRALRIAVEQVLDRNGARISSMNTNQASGWLVVDAYQLMVHLFTAETRGKYALDQLWRDGRVVPMAELLGAPAKPTRKRRPGGATIVRAMKRNGT